MYKLSLVDLFKTLINNDQNSQRRKHIVLRNVSSGLCIP